MTSSIPPSSSSALRPTSLPGSSFRTAWADRIIATVVFVAVFLLTLFGIANRFAVNSDNMYFLLAGEDVLSGNWLLTGWHGGYFSGLTSDILVTALLRALHGRRAALYLTGPLAVATLAVAALRLIGLRHADGSFAWERLLCWLPIVTLPPTLRHPMATVGMHSLVIALMIVLIAMLAAAEERTASGRAIPRFVKLVYALLVWAGCLADGYVLYFFVAPVLALCLMDGGLARIRKTDEWGRYGELAAWTAVAALLAPLALNLLRAAGGLTLTQGSSSLVPFPEIGRYFVNFLETWTRLFARNPWAQRPQAFAFISADFIFSVFFGIVSLALLVWNGVRIVKSYLETPFIDKLLFACGGFSVASFTLTTVTLGETAFRYLAPAYFFGMILIARKVSVEGDKCRSCFSRLVTVIYVLIALRNFPTTFSARPVSDDRLVGIADALKDRGVNRCYGTYWESLALNYYGGDAVEVAPIEFRDGAIRAYTGSMHDDWYTLSWDARCIIVGEPKPFGLTGERINANFGAPDEILRYNEAELYFYDRNLSERIELN